MTSRCMKVAFLPSGTDPLESRAVRDRRAVHLAIAKDTGPLDGLLSGDRAADTLDLLHKASAEGPGDPHRDHDWFAPGDPAFWTEVRALTALRDAPAAHAVRHDVPAPAPEVRQVPPP